jgi:hypothetical protein
MAVSDLGTPKSISFKCEGCRKTQSPRAMPQSFGKCRRCEHASWALDLEFAPNSRDERNDFLIGWLGSCRRGGGVDWPCFRSRQ